MASAGGRWLVQKQPIALSADRIDVGVTVVVEIGKYRSGSVDGRALCGIAAEANLARNVCETDRVVAERSASPARA